MKRNLALKVRLYPNKEQETFINKCIGCTRLLYNTMLYERLQVYEQYKNNKEILRNWKYRSYVKIEELYPFMKEVDSQALGWVKVYLERAYKNFFNSISGKYKGSYGFPKYKRKKNGGSYTTTFIKFKDPNHIRLPKLGFVKCKGFRFIKGKIKQATVRKTPSGKYYCSILYEQEVEEINKVQLTESSKIIGLDMSLSKFYVDSEGKSPKYIKRYRKNEKKLKRLNHIESRKKKASERRKKLRKSINLLNEKLTNQRQDFLHKLSISLVRENDVIVVEDLSMQAMSQCLHLGKSVMDLGWTAFIHQLQYKAEWYGKHFVLADKNFPSSKLCHCCGFKNETLTLDQRSWICPNCGFNHDRDLNAAINLRNLGICYARKCTLSHEVTKTLKCINYIS